MSHEPTAADIPPFWSRMHHFFLFPFQGAPLMRIGIVFFVTWAAIKVGINLMGNRGNSIVAIIALTLIVIVFIFSVSASYFFKVIQNSSVGLLKSKDFTPSWKDQRSTNLHWKMLILFIIIGAAAAMMTHKLGIPNYIPIIAISLSLPAIIIQMTLTESIFSSLNPLGWLKVILSIGKSYIIIIIYTLLLSAANERLIETLSPALSVELLVSVFSAGNTFFIFVQASLIGYVMYQHHERLGIDLESSAAHSNESSGRSARDNASQSADRHVSEMIMSGNIDHAIDVAHEAQRMAPDDVNAQERYHKVLLLAEKNEKLGQHAERFIPLLINQSMIPRAVQVLQACQTQGASVSLPSPDHLVALARHLAKRGDEEGAWNLIRDLDKAYSIHPSLPAAMEIGVRLLVQDLNRKEDAVRWVELMEKRFPKSPHSAEARWLVR